MTAPARHPEHALVAGPVTRTQIVRFAGAAGDFNPMHHDEAFATAAGEPSVFAMGQLTAAIVAGALSRWFGEEAIAAYGVRFRDKVWPGDRLRVHAGADVTGADVEGGGKTRYTLTVTRESDSTVVLTGWARLRAETEVA